MLIDPARDYTPAEFVLRQSNAAEEIRQILRRVVYPVVNAAVSPFLAQRYARSDFKPDLWLWGQRGNDYPRHRRRVDRLHGIRGRDVLIVGCGSGRDVLSWVVHSPKSIVAVDLMNYRRAWGMLSVEIRRMAPGIQVIFEQADVGDFGWRPRANFDIIASDAVLEHVRDLGSFLAHAHRLLKPGGLFYATFGPLWHTWGGDHISGCDALGTGFNHLLCSHDNWLAYLDSLGPRAENEDDGRFWVDADLFSRLRPVDYLKCFDQLEFRRQFVAAIIEPRALAFLKQYPEKAQRLRARYDLIDLIVTGMTTIYKT